MSKRDKKGIIYERRGQKSLKIGQKGPKGAYKYDEQAVVKFLTRMVNRVENDEIGRKSSKRLKMSTQGQKGV